MQGVAGPCAHDRDAGIPTGDGNTNPAMTMKDEIDGIKVTAVGRVWRAVNRMSLMRAFISPTRYEEPNPTNTTRRASPNHVPVTVAANRCRASATSVGNDHLVRLQSAFLPDFNHSASSSLRDGPGTNDRTVPPVHSALIEGLLTRTIKGARNEAACFFEEANAYLFGEAYLVRPAFVLSSWSLILICLGSNPSVRTSSRLLDPVFLTSLRAYHSALFLLRDRGRSPIHLFPIV
ncbi:hypothetical protein C8J57DRAFT_1713614 [Mycena rebaudengoi]|nr:hypothetical protein C8J57DRAFT_1713614 [Mycena rebaudengoi]